MKEYRNEGGKSGVARYELGADSITIEYSSGATYLYTVESAGRETIDTMKQLAEAGKGLNSFIGMHARRKYSKKNGNDPVS